ncbi:MAG: hypothetical protein QM817_37505 [Archangium sp.]
MKSALACLTLLVLAVSACKENETPEAYMWSVRDMLTPDEDEGGLEQDLGGWKPRQLVVPVGQPLFFEENELVVNNDGIVVQPGVADGVSAPFVITEVWKNHPVPWLQPVWTPRDSSGKQMPDMLNVFSVNDDATFYSPFWQLEDVRGPKLQKDNVGFKTAREVFAVIDDESTTHQLGPLVYCPIIPENVQYARGSKGLRDPSSLGAVKELFEAFAWAPNPTGNPEAVKVRYIGMGVDRYQIANQLPVASRGYFFVTRPGGPVLPVSAVLPSSPSTHAFVTRIDAVLPATAGVYLPTSRPLLRERLLNESVSAPVPTLRNDNHPERALQVALDATCFSGTATDGGMDPDIADCVWLDSEAAIIRAGLVIAEQPVQLAIGTVNK